MTSAEAYAEELAVLRGLLGQPVRGMHLLEFATIPQLRSIIDDLRPMCAGRGCEEITYDPPQENATLLIERIRERLQELPSDPPPLLILRPIALPDATHDGPVAIAFWKALNFRREALGALPAQILLCVDPWHYGHLLDEALDLLSWLTPRFHLIPPPDSSPARTEMLTGATAFGELQTTPEAAHSRWETFWPIVEEQRRSGPLPPSSIRRHILPLLESALASGNLVRARMVRDAAAETVIPPEDLVPWHKLNAILACGAGDITMIEDHANCLLAIMEKPGDERLRDAAAMELTDVSNLLANLGHLIFAESMNRHLLEYSQTSFGPEHLDTLTSRNNLANTLRNQGKHAEAELEHRAVLAIRERLLGPEHPHTLSSRNNLANALNSQGKHAEAEVEYRAVLDIRERTNGPVHADTLMSRNNLAGALRAQGRLAEAEREHRTVLTMRERVLGPQHPDVFQTCYNLSLALEDLGRKREALEFARRALAGWNKVLGENHPNSKAAKRQVEDLERE